MNDSLRLKDSRKRAARLLSYAVMILAPFLLLGAISLAIGKNAFNASPVWSNELGYWRALFNWSEVGFATGYSGLFEEIPVSGALDSSGIAPLLIYGWFVKLFGMAPNALLICNALWLSLASLVFCLLNRPRPVTALLMAGLTVLYMPIILYCTTSMMELFDYALVLLFLAFLLAYARKRRVWTLVLCCAVVILGCLYRPLYGLLFFPLIFVFGRERFGWRTICGLLLSLVLFGACWLVNNRYCAPEPQNFLYHLLHAPDAETFLRMILSHSKANLMNVFLRTSSAMEAVQRCLYFAVTLLCLFASFLSITREQGRVRVRLAFHPWALGCFLMLLAAFGLVIMLYETNDWRDYRYLAPFLWMVLVLFAARGRFVVPSLSLAGCAGALALLLTLSPVGAFDDAYRFDPAPDSPALSEALSVITYDAEASDPFDNSVRIDVLSFQAMRELAPGLGLQTGWFTTETTGKSRWILTDHLKCPVTGYERVAETDGFKVYRLVETVKED